MAENGARSRGIEDALKAVGALVALGSFLWGIYTYRDAAARSAETRRIEATKPFLERQLKLYTEATQAAATIATGEEGPAKTRATRRFWELYWGELALVENGTVEQAMASFGVGLRAGLGRDEMQRRSLALARACRDSLAVSWGVADWKRQSRQP